MCATGTLPVASQIRIARRTETASRHCRQRREKRDLKTLIVRPSSKSLYGRRSAYRSEINALNIPVLLRTTPLPATSVSTTVGRITSTLSVPVPP